MKKILLFLMAFCLFCVTAAASPKLYHHPAYDFSNIRNVKVTVITNTNPQNKDNFYAEVMAEEKMLSALYSAAGNQKLILTDERANGPLAPTGEPESLFTPNKKAPKTVEVRVSINYLGYRSNLVPGHYEQKTEYIKEKHKNSRGQEQYVEIPITTKVWVPDAYRSDSLMDVIYNVYDLETAAVIANVMDRRERQYEEDTSGMLKRSTKDFLKALTKK